MESAKWESILAEAASAFARYGFRKTSMEEIATAAGVAKGTLYLGCKSKRDLFYQAILRDLRRWNATLSEQIDPRTPAEELLMLLAAQAFTTRLEFPLAHGLIMGEFDADLPDWVEHLDELRAHSLTTVLEILRIGVRQERFRADLDLEDVGQVLVGLITSIMFEARGPDREARLMRRAQVAFDLVLHGLRPRVPADAPTP